MTETRGMARGIMGEWENEVLEEKKQLMNSLPEYLNLLRCKGQGVVQTVITPCPQDPSCVPPGLRLLSHHTMYAGVELGDTSTSVRT